MENSKKVPEGWTVLEGGSKLAKEISDIFPINWASIIDGAISESSANSDTKAPYGTNFLERYYILLQNEIEDPNDRQIYNLHIGNTSIEDIARITGLDLEEASYRLNTIRKFLDENC